MAAEFLQERDGVAESIFDDIPGLRATLGARLAVRGRDMQTMNPAWVEHCAEEAARVRRVIIGSTGELGVMEVIDQAVAYCLDDAELAGWLEE